MAKKKTQFELPPIEFEAAGSTPQEQKAVLETVEPSEGFPLMTLMCIDLILRRVDLAVFDFSAQSVPFRYQIDGLWLNMPGMDREAGDSLLASLKQMAGLNWQDRRSRQEGKFRSLFEKNRYEFRVVTQGVKTGERVAVYVGRKRAPLDSLSDLGMRDGMKAQLAEVLNSDRGMAVSSAVAGEGYTACWRGLLSGGDRYLRDYYVIEEEGRQEPEVINVNTVCHPAGSSHFAPVPQLLLKEPQVLAFPDLATGGDLNEMNELIDEKDLLVLTRVPARNASSAIARLVSLRPQLPQLAANLRAVLTMRLVRKLCPQCRQPFPPSAQLLSRLGFPPGRVRQLWRPAVMRGDEVDEKGEPVPPCQKCYGTGYLGRTGVFEMFLIGGNLRKAVAAGETRPESLHAAALEDGQVSLQDELAFLVARGVTSLEEMQRTLADPAKQKQETES